ncbi:hypothetical protein D0C16_12660 [Cellvibrio sp. KY-GH-1]|uniref:hypothetical protein n=1 Tax=Cellvibrio sp. KY-GH-1 TaxID=2303332 RepID=UPI0012479712|nr:hypothetical protein [Cellvibrio sp. KY-GH-1]QEY16745.1 hypothetical protein D0C16_12660 [Cellvibrio sp. KY-GH-1]
MMCSFEIKSSLELVWADIPYIGNPIFVVGMVMDYLQMRNSVWGRITNIDSFHKEAVPHYSALNNHYVVRDEVDQLFRSGRYYGVSRTQRPTSALYDWRELAGHPEGGKWYASSAFYIDMSKRLLQRLDAKRHQQASWATEEAAMAEELAAAVRSIRSKPETSASAIPKQVSRSQPQSLEECAQRLVDAAPAVQAAKNAGKPLPHSAYTQADKQAVVDSGVTERFMVRIFETRPEGDTGYIAQKREHGATIAWMAPLSMVEHGDTDAEALLNAFGTRHKPGANYTILIIDTHKMNEVADVKTIIPTNANLQKLMADNPQITKVSPEVSKQVLSQDFAPKYYKFAKGMSAAKIKQNKQDDMENFALGQGFSKIEADALIARHQLATDVSAWEEFTGNGMTLDTNVKDGTAYGPVELVMLDKSPKTLGELKKQNAILSLTAN